MERDDVLIAFKGSITSELLTSILQIMETKMEDLHEAPRTKKKVFNVLVECLQNLYHHIDDFEVQGSAEEVSEKKSAIFSISRTVESYNIVTGNFVSNENVTNLTNKKPKIKTSSISTKILFPANPSAKISNFPEGNPSLNGINPTT